MATYQFIPNSSTATSLFYKFAHLSDLPWIRSTAQITQAWWEFNCSLKLQSAFKTVTFTIDPGYIKLLFIQSEHPLENFVQKYNTTVCVYRTPVQRNSGHIEWHATPQQVAHLLKAFPRLLFSHWPVSAAQPWTPVGSASYVNMFIVKSLDAYGTSHVAASLMKAPRKSTVL